MKALAIGFFFVLASCSLSYDTRDRYTVECTCERLVYDKDTYLCRLCNLPIPVKYRHEGTGIIRERPIRDI